LQLLQHGGGKRGGQLLTYLSKVREERGRAARGNQISPRTVSWANLLERGRFDREDCRELQEKGRTFELKSGGFLQVKYQASRAAKREAGIRKKKAAKRLILCWT